MTKKVVREVFNISVPELGEISVAEKPCLLCGKRYFIPLNTFILNQRRFHTVRCIHDGMMWLEPQPTEEFYRRIYSAYYHNTSTIDPLFEQATLDVHSNTEELKRNARLRLDQIEQFVNTGRLLEVGYGNGAMLEEANNKGWKVVGLEVDQSCVNQMKKQGISAFCSDLLNYDGELNSFDVIGMYSVIEHTLDPAANLLKSFSLLKTGGILVLRLPDTEAQGPPASLIAHVYHFNAHTIMVLLRKCGFEILRIGSFGLWKPKKYPGEQWSMNVVSRKVEVSQASD
jgi:2-polyprenyl-3-methyl-5-hydroxy-6-metoxy-1,4-benzoquinol methylase